MGGWGGGENMMGMGRRVGWECWNGGGNEG